MAEDLQKELELYQQEEGPKVEAAKKRIEELQNQAAEPEPLGVVEHEHAALHPVNEVEVE